MHRTDAVAERSRLQKLLDAYESGRLTHQDEDERGELKRDVTPEDELADALGLTPVHVNRTLRGLEAESLIERTRRSVRIPDWKALAAVGDFDPNYLHLDAEAVHSR